MMKILTQKMVGAQGLEAGMSGFCHFGGVLIFKILPVILPSLDPCHSEALARNLGFVPAQAGTQAPPSCSG
jgi:hypothetical protein